MDSVSKHVLKHVLCPTARPGFARRSAAGNDAMKGRGRHDVKGERYDWLLIKSDSSGER